MTMTDDDKPELYIPESRSRAGYEAELASGDADRIGLALIDSSYQEDWAWVQARCLEGLSSAFAGVRGRALIALQVLAAIRRELDPVAVVPAVTPLLRDPDRHVALSAQDVLNDIRNIFGH